MNWTQTEVESYVKDISNSNKLLKEKNYSLSVKTSYWKEQYSKQLHLNTELLSHNQQLLVNITEHEKTIERINEKNIILVDKCRLLKELYTLAKQ